MKIVFVNCGVISGCIVNILLLLNIISPSRMLLNHLKLMRLNCFSPILTPCEFQFRVGDGHVTSP